MPNSEISKTITNKLRTPEGPQQNSSKLNLNKIRKGVMPKILGFQDL